MLLMAFKTGVFVCVYEGSETRGMNTKIVSKAYVDGRYQEPIK